MNDDYLGSLLEKLIMVGLDIDYAVNTGDWTDINNSLVLKGLDDDVVSELYDYINEGHMGMLIWEEEMEMLE